MYKQAYEASVNRVLEKRAAEIAALGSFTQDQNNRLLKGLATNTPIGGLLPRSPMSIYNRPHIPIPTNMPTIDPARHVEQGPDDDGTDNPTYNIPEVFNRYRRDPRRKVQELDNQQHDPVPFPLPRYGESIIPRLRRPAPTPVPAPAPAPTQDVPAPDAYDPEDLSYNLPKPRRGM